MPRILRINSLADLRRWVDDHISSTPRGAKHHDPATHDQLVPLVADAINEGGSNMGESPRWGDDWSEWLAGIDLVGPQGLAERYHAAAELLAYPNGENDEYTPGGRQHAEAGRSESAQEN